MTKPRLVSILVFLIGCGILGFSLHRTYSSGEMIARYPITSFRASTLTEGATAMRKTQLLIGKETHRDFKSTDLFTVPPDLSMVELRLVIDKSLGGRENLFRPKYRVIDSDGNTVFQKD